MGRICVVEACGSEYYPDCGLSFHSFKMSGDIDIEEHDLMENPRIRSIFPDLTLLKKEILDQEESLQLNNSLPSKKDQNVESDTIINFKQEIKLEENVTKDQLDFRLSGSDRSRSIPVFSNKIILGSKPCGQKSDKKLKYEVKIFIKDIKMYLMKSERYCALCQILFPQSHMLEHHKSVNHTIGKNNISTGQLHNSKNITNLHGNFINRCFHCKVLFPSQESLIEHLYDILEKKQAGAAKKVFENSKTVPDNYTEKRKIVSKDSGVHMAISNIDCQNNSTDKRTCEGKSLYDEECETSDDDRDFPSISVNSRDCETVPDATSCDTISTNDESSEQSKLDDIEILCNISLNEVFQCEICSYYFHQQKFYDSHMIKKHNSKMKNKNIVKFNPKCKFCSAMYTGVKQYNAHLHKRHSEMIFKGKSDDVLPSQCQLHNIYENKNENTFKTSKAETVTPIIQKSKSNNDLLTATKLNIDLLTASYMIFKTVLFKCLKCDVHFLSPNLATNHIVHNEMLINWRCSLCKIFFKKNDEEIHSKQHLYTSSFKIYNLDATDLGKILIKCSKCAVYIPKDNVPYHSKVCETNIQTWLCTICDINIDANEKRTHKISHGDRNNKKTDFIIINDCIMNKATNEASSDLSTEITEVVESTSTSETDETDSEDHDADESEIMSPVTNLEVEDELPTPRQLKRKKDNTQNSKSNRIKRRKLNDCTSDKSNFYSKLNYKSQFRHKLLLNLTYCQFCECFITMYHKVDIHLEKRCIHILKRVCNICGLIFTAKAIRGHKEFHELNPGLKLQDFTFYDIETSEVIVPPIPKYPKCENCETHFLNKPKITSHICNEKQLYSKCDICAMKFCNETINLHISFHGYYLKSKSSIEEELEVNNECIDKEVKLDLPKSNQGLELKVQSTHNLDQKSTVKNSQQSMMLMYTCVNCSVTVNTYDQLVEHCHSHYDNSYKNIKTKECAQCNVLFEELSFTSHNELHDHGVCKESFKIFIVDIFHFGCSNREWLNHVFKSLSDNEIDEIVKDSLYRFEYRVKLDISQQGTQELTLYRCIKCGITIDCCDIYKHRAICQGVNKKYPCDYCGIALLSTALRSQHIKIHKQANISIKSYRIVVFNRAKDKALNDAMTIQNNHYVLHQCRVCNGVVDRKLLQIHKCNIDDLKKCNHCGLLICSDDYEKHMSKHKLSNTFIASNMKVVLFGQSTMESKERNEKALFFNGIVYDYTFYKCVKCDVCIQHLRPSSRHFCLIDAAKYKCLKCELVFDEGKKKSHRLLHNSDVEFTKDTICVIPFDPQETYDCLEKELRSKSKTSLHGRDKDPEDGVDSVKEETDVIYKCGLTDSCGLHYVTEESAKNHVAKRKCHMYLKKNVKQTCSKCNLVFTSDVLFKHLIKHHGDKNVKYKLDIVNVEEISDGR